MVSEPHSVANYLKKVLKYMGEPLCTFALYNKFRDLSGKIHTHKAMNINTDVKIEDRVEKLKEICSKLPDINKHTLVYLIRFLMKVVDQS